MAENAAQPPMPLFKKAYSTLFKGIDPSDGRVAFWDELFLVKVLQDVLHKTCLPERCK